MSYHTRLQKNISRIILLTLGKMKLCSGVYRETYICLMNLLPIEEATSVLKGKVNILVTQVRVIFQESFSTIIHKIFETNSRFHVK